MRQASVIEILAAGVASALVILAFAFAVKLVGNVLAVLAVVALACYSLVAALESWR